MIYRDGGVSARLRAAVAEALQRGIRVMLATGRMVQSAERIWRDLGLSDGYLITYNGAVIADMPAGTPQSTHALPESAARWLAREALAAGILTQIYVGRELWVSEEDERVRRYIDAHHIPAWVRVDGKLLDWPEPPIKVLLQGDSVVLDQFRSRVQARGHELGVRIFKSQSDYLEMVAEGVGKGPALAQVAQWLGIDRAEIIAVGDAENDIDMIGWAGRGVAMGQAGPNVKRHARWITGPVDQDGAALAIEELALGLSNPMERLTPGAAQE